VIVCCVEQRSSALPGLASAVCSFGGHLPHCSIVFCICASWTQFQVRRVPLRACAASSWRWQLLLDSLRGCTCVHSCSLQAYGAALDSGILTLLLHADLLVGGIAAAPAAVAVHSVGGGCRVAAVAALTLLSNCRCCVSIASNGLDMAWLSGMRAGRL
jgi:hypothetical protein